MAPPPSDLVEMGDRYCAIFFYQAGFWVDPKIDEPFPEPLITTDSQLNGVACRQLAGETVIIIMGYHIGVIIKVPTRASNQPPPHWLIDDRVLSEDDAICLAMLEAIELYREYEPRDPNCQVLRPKVAIYSPSRDSSHNISSASDFYFKNGIQLATALTNSRGPEYSNRSSQYRSNFGNPFVFKSTVSLPPKEVWEYTVQGYRAEKKTWNTWETGGHTQRWIGMRARHIWDSDTHIKTSAHVVYNGWTLLGSLPSKKVRNIVMNPEGLKSVAQMEWRDP